MTTYSSTKFMFHRESFMMTAEMSDLRLGFKQIYPDAADMGITISSHRTGKLMDFAVNHIEYSAGGEDLMWWDLIPAFKHKIKDPLVQRLRVRIYND